MSRRRGTGTGGRAAKRARALPDALPFVIFDKDRFSVNPEAVTFLESLGDTKLAVVALAGPYRHGKSFLLNRVVLQNPPNEGFMVGQTVNACTKGLHIATKLLRASNSSDGDYAVLVVDTEGLGAMTASDTHDARIFSLALLLSSQFIYNSKGTIDQPALNNLSLVANISQHIKAGDGADLSSFLPSFLWVVRDFALDLVDEHGEAMDQKEYLEQALRPVPDAPPEKNQVRTSLRDYFRHRDCVTMIRPCDDEATLKTLNEQPDASLKPEFQAQAKALREKILLQARPKQACDTVVTGKLLVRLASVYCESINTGACPAIQDSWSLISADECTRAVEAAAKAFADHLAEHQADGSALDPAGDRAVVPSGQLEQCFTAGFEKALAVFKARAIGTQVQPHLEKLREALRQHAARVRAENMEVVKRHAQAACAELDDRLTELPSFEEVRKQYGTLEAKFLKRVGADTATRAAWSEQAATKVWDWAARYHIELNGRCVEATVELKAAKEKIPDMVSELEGLRRDVRGLQDALAAEKERAAEASAGLDEARRVSDGYRAEMAAHAEELDAIETRLREQSDAHQEQLSRVEVERDEESRKLVAAMRQLDEASEQAARLRENMGAATAELEALRKQAKAHAEQAQKLAQLHDSNALLGRQVDDLTERMEAEAEHHRTEIQTLHAESTKTIQGLQRVKEEAAQKARAAATAQGAAEQQLAKLKRDHAKQLEQLAREAERLRAELSKAEQQRDDERVEAKRETSALRGTLSDNAKRFQQQLDENAAQHREETRRRSAKVREEQEKLFQEKVSAQSRAQTAESRVTQAEEAVREAREALSRERDRARQENYAGRVAELENKLATATTRAELMQSNVTEKADLVAEQQSRITELEAELRQIGQRHEAEKMRLELDHARKMSGVSD